MDQKVKLILSLVIPSILFILISLPLMRNKIPPNCAYGFRLKKTLANKEIWYKANQFGGRCIAWAGFISLAGCFWLFLNKENLSWAMINNMGLGFFVLPLIGALVLSLGYIKKL